MNPGNIRCSLALNGGNQFLNEGVTGGNVLGLNGEVGVLFFKLFDQLVEGRHRIGDETVPECNRDFSVRLIFLLSTTEHENKKCAYANESDELRLHNSSIIVLCKRLCNFQKISCLHF